ncbi:hypothetical protein HUJ05_007688 [Dendroctonus ponderosae]|nr:hypothetical protein HUJ05_007688 [Dendroctonus ponderosae]
MTESGGKPVLKSVWHSCRTFPTSHRAWPLDFPLLPSRPFVSLPPPRYPSSVTRLAKHAKTLQLRPSAPPICSIASLVTLLGCLCSGPITDRFGRRKTIRVVNVCALIGWLIIGAASYSPAKQYALLLVRRFVTGVSGDRATIIQCGPVFLAFWPTGRHGGLTAGFPVNMGSGLQPQKHWTGGKTK